MVQPEHRRLLVYAAAPLLLAVTTSFVSGCARAAPVSSSQSPSSSSDGNADASAADIRLAARVSEGPPIPLSTAGHVGGLVDGAPVVAGGSSWSADRTTKRWNHECFVYRDGEWNPGPSLPQPLSDAAYAYGSRGLYAAGGTDGKKPTNAVLHLADTSDTASWQRLTPLPATVEAASGAILSDTFYVFGGFSNGKPSNQLWALDLRKRHAKWRTLAPLPADGRGYGALVAVGDQLYQLGGFILPPYTPKPAVFGDVYRYDPAADRWSKVEGLDLPGYGWTATAVGPQQIMLTGRCPEISVVVDDVLLLDLATREARTIGKLVIPACCMPAIRVGSRTWWLPGGEPDATRNRTARTSIVKLEKTSIHE